MIRERRSRIYTLLPSFASLSLQGEGRGEARDGDGPSGILIFCVSESLPGAVFPDAVRGRGSG